MHSIVYKVCGYLVHVKLIIDESRIYTIRSVKSAGTNSVISSLDENSDIYGAKFSDRNNKHIPAFFQSVDRYLNGNLY